MPKFRVQLPLLVFHLALLLIILLATAGRLTYLKGWAEVSAGGEFVGELGGGDFGPWHRERYQQVRFTNEGFEINYNPGPRRTFTFNQVSWLDEDGQRQQQLIGDQVPLVLQGYRFYTSHNKGFAPVLAWTPRGAEQPMVGDIHLPSYPAQALRQSLEWTPPGSSKPLWFLLQFDELILEPDVPSKFRPPEDHLLVVREDENRYELRPGDKVELSEGTLVYLRLGTWMGYKVYYDWTRPWLLAAVLLAVLALAWHLWRRFFTRPWLQ